MPMPRRLLPRRSNPPPSSLHRQHQRSFDRGRATRSMFARARAARRWTSASCATRAIACRAPGSSARSSGGSAPGSNVDRRAGPKANRLALLAKERHQARRWRSARSAAGRAWPPSRSSPHARRCAPGPARHARQADRCRTGPAPLPPAVWITNSCCLTASCRSRASRARSSCLAALRICGLVVASAGR